MCENLPTSFSSNRAARNTLCTPIAALILANISCVISHLPVWLLGLLFVLFNISQPVLRTACDSRQPLLLGFHHHPFGVDTVCFKRRPKDPSTLKTLVSEVELIFLIHSNLSVDGVLVHYQDNEPAATPLRQFWRSGLRSAGTKQQTHRIRKTLENPPEPLLHRLSKPCSFDDH